MERQVTFDRVSVRPANAFDSPQLDHGRREAPGIDTLKQLGVVQRVPRAQCVQRKLEGGARSGPVKIDSSVVEAYVQKASHARRPEADRTDRRAGFDEDGRPALAHFE